jgi:rhamnulokinase
MSRFQNAPVPVAGTFHWYILRLYQGILKGLSVIAHDPNHDNPASIGVDSWGVDYGLLDAGGQLLGNPISYRDSRTDGIMDRVLADGNGPEIYQRTGIQFLTFNTLYQLMAAKNSPQLSSAKHLLLIPDLINYWLTGSIGIEYTNASTTQLVNLAARNWDYDLLQRFGLPRGILPELRQSGDQVGRLTPGIQELTGLGPVPVVAVGSHDTASAVVGVPAVN